MTMDTPEALQKNGSLFLHVFMVKTGRSPNPTDKNYAGREVSVDLREYIIFF